MALFCGHAAGAAVRGPSLVRSQEGPRLRGRTAGPGGRDAEAGRGPVSRRGPGRGIPTAAALWPDRPVQRQAGRVLGLEPGSSVSRGMDQLEIGGDVVWADGPGKVVSSWLLGNR